MSCRIDSDEQYLTSDKQNSSNNTEIKMVPSSWLKASNKINTSSVFYVILPYLPLSIIVKLQALNSKFYNRFVPIVIANINQIGGAGLGKQPHKVYLKESLIQISKTAGLAKWSFELDKCDVLEKVTLKEKVQKNRHSNIFLRAKQTFEGNAAKVIPMS